MNRHKQYKSFTKIDLRMFFYCFELDKESKKLCAINIPYRLYCYKRLTMGVMQGYVRPCLKEDQGYIGWT